LVILDRLDLNERIAAISSSRETAARSRVPIKSSPAKIGNASSTMRKNGERYPSTISYPQRKAYLVIRRCRISARGDHIDAYYCCGFETGTFYTSCCSRCCRNFQRRARQHWIEGQQLDLVPTNYSEIPAESHATNEPHNQHNHNNCSYDTQT
jgi:hypothetical protein